MGNNAKKCEPCSNGNGSLLEIIRQDASEGIEKLNGEKEVNKWKTGTDLILAGVENIPCLVDPIIPKTGIVVFAGSSDTGKSTILRGRITGHNNIRYYKTSEKRQ